MAYVHIVCDSSLCTGCRLCEFGCAQSHEGAFDLALSRIHVAHPEPTLSLAVACRLCSDAPCVASCPRDALSVDGEKGILKLNKALCTGCGWCVEACDFGAITLDRRSKSVIFCDLCHDRLAADETALPACVETCPKDALTLRSLDSLAASARDRLAREEAGAKA